MSHDIPGEIYIYIIDFTNRNDSYTNLRILVKQIYVHQNDDKSLDVRFEFNGDFEDSSVVYTNEESA